MQRFINLLVFGGLAGLISGRKKRQKE